MFGQGGIHKIPGLGIANKDVHLRLEQRRIVETRSHHAKNSFFRIFRASQARAALSAEPAKVMTTAQAGSRIMLERALGDFKGAKGKNNGRDIRPTADLLAIAAMTLEHQQWRGGGFIPDRPTNTTASNGKFHDTGDLFYFREKFRGGLAGGGAEFLQGAFSYLRNGFGNFFDVGGFATFAAIRNGREVGAIGFEHELAGRRGGDGVADVLAVFEGDNAGKAHEGADV